MAKQNQIQIPTPVSDPITNTPSTRYIDYDTLTFIPVEEKNEEWAAEVIAYIKQNSKEFITEREVTRMRDLEEGKLSIEDYKELIDPTAAEEGEDPAEFFTADWKSNPIFNHLNRLIEAGLEKIPINLYVKAADEFSQLSLEKENSRILGRQEMMAYLNYFNNKLGFPPVNKNSDPFRYASQMNGATTSGQPGGNPTVSPPIKVIDSIKANIEDDEDLALFNEYIWKDGAEIAFEIGIKYYIQDVNHFDRIYERAIKDIKNFNKTLLRYYTSETTGLPIIEYLEPHLVYTSLYKKADGADITHWYTEYTISYGDFVRMFGMGLDKDTLKAIFVMNRENHGINDDYEKISFLRRNTARIRIGYAEWESQDMEVYSDYTIQGNAYFAKKPSSYTPGKNQAKDWNATREEQHYNVWYKCYYIPLAGSAINAASVDFKKQGGFIFKFGKVQDQQREGDDYRYSKTSLIAWSNPGMSFGEIMSRYMGKINLLWFQFQNDLANVIPHGMIFYKEFMEMALSSQDSASDGKDATSKFIRKLKQTGNQVGKLYDQDGNPNSQQFRPYDEIKTGHLASAIEKLNAMSAIYDMMKTALGISDTREGQDPKPRQVGAGIKLALQASNDSTYYVEKGCTAIVNELGNRLLYFINDIINEAPTSPRLQDFKAVVGKANGMALEALRSIPMKQLGFGVLNVMTDDQKAQLQEMVNQMATAGQIDIDVALFLQTIDDLKYAFAIVRLYVKKKQKEQAQQAQVAFQQQQQLKQMDLDNTNNLQKLKDQDMLQQIELGKKLDAWLLQVDNQLKTQGAIQVKGVIKDNRLEEASANAAIAKQLAVDIPQAEVEIPNVIHGA